MLDNFDEEYAEAKKGVLPYESWEKLEKESAAAFAAFCNFRDYGTDRNIKRALEQTEPDTIKRAKRYRLWLSWSARFCWGRRAADYDVYLDKLKQTERRRTIETREEAYREVTGKMLETVNKKLDLMRPDELAQNNIKEWMEAAINTERGIFGICDKTKRDAGQPVLGQPDNSQLEINFTGDFENL